MKTFLPKRLSGQLILLLLGTLVLSQLFSIVFFLSESDYIVEQIEKNQIIRRSAQAANVLAAVPKQHHLAVLKAISVHRVKFLLDNKPAISPAENIKTHYAEEQMLKNMLNKHYNSVFVYQHEVPKNRFLALFEYFYSKLILDEQFENKKLERYKLLSTSIELSDGQWLNMDVYGQDIFPLWAKSTLFSLLIMSIILLVIVVFTVKRITLPLKELAAKAQQLGVGENVQPVTERGPEDIQHAVRAFNQMQHRLNKMIVHRARSLAAMSHDLRTPLTSLRLHAEFITNEETQENIIDKIDEMEQITKATISFAKQDAWLEQMKKVDLTALLESLCLDLSDLGMKVEYLITDKINYSCRPVALKRAFSNLIENGVKYGESVHVEISEQSDQIKVIISDQGQGIPESEHNRMFEAFERMEVSRNKESGGMGLGMTIALTVIQDHGGEIQLQNRASKGLDVVILLPKK